MNELVVKIEQTLMAEPAVAMIQQMMEEDEAKAKKYLANVMQCVKGGNSYLQSADPASFLSCAVDAINLELAIDSRQLAYLVPYKNKNTGLVEASLQVGWRGFVHQIKRYNKTADIQTGLVYKGDKFKKYSVSGVAKYKHEPKVANCFESNPAELVGAYCYISYSVDGRERAVCETIGKAELESIKGCSKQKDDYNVWNTWYGEQAKKSVLKRTCKLHFAGAVHELDSYDNTNYDMEQETTTNKADIWNAPQKSPEPETRLGDNAKDISPDTEPEVEPAADAAVTATEDVADDTPGSKNPLILSIEGKPSKELDSLAGAAQYLSTVIGNHNTKKSREALYQENQHLLDALHDADEHELAYGLQTLVEAGSDE